MAGDLGEEIAVRLVTEDQRREAIRLLVLDVLFEALGDTFILDDDAAESVDILENCARVIAGTAWHQMQAEGSDLRLQTLITNCIIRNARFRRAREPR